MREVNDPRLKAELALLEKKAHAIKERQRQIMLKAGKLARTTQNQRKFIAGAVALRALETNAAFRQSFGEILKAEVLEQDRYKFPEFWPDAVKPESKQRKAESKPATQETPAAHTTAARRPAFVRPSTAEVTHDKNPSLDDLF